MADGILASEEIRQAALTDGGATLAGAVAQTLQRCVEEICRLPEARTKQGRKRIAKMLQLLEKELMPRLAAMVKGRTKINLAPVAVAFAEMQEDLAVDSLAGDYMKKRSAMEATEKKILKFLKQNAERNTAAGEALRERLAAEGLTPEGWRVLQAAAARGQGKKRGGAGSGRVGGSALSEMLEGLDGLLRPQGLDAAERGRKVAEAAGKLGELMEATAAATEKKLDDLSRIADELSKEGDSLDPQQQRREMSRRRLMEVLAEVVQELFQPLTVITTTVQMLAARHLGEINGEQEAMLKLSGDAGERLAHLADRLRNICGNPEGRIPDAVILEKIYDG